jgi:SAM-dependent methyltransferase
VLPDSADILADRESPAYAPNAILHSRNHVERWLTIPEVVRTGRQVPRSPTDSRRRVFVQSMHDCSRPAAPEIVERCLKRRPGIRSVLDVGGGPGTYARLFSERNIDVTILDRPEVIEIAQPELKAWSRIRMVPGDFHRELPPGPFDLVLMGNIFHIYGPEENLKLLERARGTLNIGGVVAIVDLVRGRSSRAPLFALTMLVNTDSGGAWT